MNLISRLFSSLTTAKPPPMLPLWQAIVAEARDPHWYLRHGVADTVDGRFDMVALISSLVMLRLEALDMRAESSLLTECFVADMDGSVRALGIGDMVVGKHVGRMTGALGGRLGAYRAALAADAPGDALIAVLARNVYRGEDAGGLAAGLATDVRALAARLAALPAPSLLEGRLSL